MTIYSGLGGEGRPVPFHVKVKKECALPFFIEAPFEHLHQGRFPGLARPYDEADLSMRQVLDKIWK